MSPASKSKSKVKIPAGKEPQKSSTKPTTHANTIGGNPASGYNPLLGTFHSLETSVLEDHIANSAGIGVEYDSVSNNGSWSGESEDHKDKNTQGPSRHETIPGVDNDKREKIRQKNEKKHQRQKERRAQELHERCSGYLMSRKLEALAQQLVSMGFSSERATMALILNEGRVEQSVAWLFEGGEDGDCNDNNRRDHNIDGGGNLKIDISEELAQITEMEIKFKCSKQEVERAIVACEGDLQQAAETLETQKQEPPPAVPPKIEETGKFSATTSRMQSKHTTFTGSIPIQQKSDEKDFNYTKMGIPVSSSSSSLPSSLSLSAVGVTEPGIKSMQLLKKIPPNSEWSKQQQGATQSVDKRWAVGGGAPPLSKTDSRFLSVESELKNLQLGSVREPVIVMQRPKSKNIPAISSSSSLSAADWRPNVVEPVIEMNQNGFSRSFSSYGTGVNAQLYDQFHYQQQQQQAVISPHHQQYASLDSHHFSQQGGNGMNHFNNGGGMWNRMVGGTTTPTLAAASSLGLFSGNGSSGPPSPVDWSVGDPLQCDYTNIDWSLDRMPGQPSGLIRPNGMWLGFGRQANTGGVGGGGGGKTTMRAPTGILSNGNGGVLHQDGVGAMVGSEASAGEWGSPFEEKELFSFPRQFVSSPSL